MRFEDTSNAGCCGVPYYYCPVNETHGDMGATGVEAQTGCVAEVEGRCECLRVVLRERVKEFGVHCSVRLSYRFPIPSKVWRVN